MSLSSIPSRALGYARLRVAIPPLLYLCLFICSITALPGVHSAVTFSSDNTSKPFYPRNLAGCLVTPSSTRLMLMGGITNSNTIVNDTWISDDVGSTWRHIQPLPNTSSPYPLLPYLAFGYTYSLVTLSNGNMVFLGGLSDRPYVSIDGGQNWRYAMDNRTYPLSAFGRMVTSVPHTNIVLLTAGHWSTLNDPRLNDVWLSDDGTAAVWSNQTHTVSPPYPPFLTGATLTALYGANPTKQIAVPIVLAGGCHDPFCKVMYNTVWVSFDYGMTWPQQRNASWSPRFSHQMAVDSDNFIYIFGGSQDSVGDLWQSTDIGLSWKQLASKSQYTYYSSACMSVQQFTTKSGRAAKELVLFSGQSNSKLSGFITACLTDDCTRYEDDSEIKHSSTILIASITSASVVCTLVLIVLIAWVIRRRTMQANSTNVQSPLLRVASE